MANRALRIAKNANKPLVNFVVLKGWYLRLIEKKRKNMHFRELTSAQKKSIKSYWKTYGKNISTDWCAFFSWGSGIIDEKYIPESLYYGEILKKLNDQDMGNGLSDKNMYDWLFDTNQPKTIIRKANGILLNKEYEPITLNQAYDLCSNQKEVILKPTNGTYGGSGINFWHYTEGEGALKSLLDERNNVIVQGIVKQHPFFDNIHPQSLNTLRVVTLIVDGEPVLLSTLLRMGRNNSKVDNFSAGGCICAVNKDGKLYETAVQADQSILEEHPDGFAFKDMQVPFFEKIINDAKRMHYRIPYFKMISWDYALSPEGDPILIEGNYPAGQLDMHQLNIGPIFGEYTDRVLDYVYKGKAL